MHESIGERAVENHRIRFLRTQESIYYILAQKSSYSHTYRGAMIESNVNITSGGAVLWILFDVPTGGFPNSMTVSADNTLLTRAIPTGGNCNTAFGVASVVVVETDGAVDGVDEEIFMDAIIAAVLLVVVMFSK
jgi:hypothetical protein